MVMRARFMLAVCVIGAVACTTACGKRKGEMPTPTTEQVNMIGDVSRDLQHVGESRPEAVGELSEDLANFGESEDAPTADLLHPLSESVVAAVQQKRVSDADAERLANLLFITLVARDLNASQIDQLKSDIESALRAIGAQPDIAKRTAESAAAIQRDRGQDSQRPYRSL